MKKLLCTILSGVLLLGSLAACGGGKASGPEKVTFWYNNTDPEATYYEEAIAAYNESQSKYVVEGLSVPDSQKLIVAMSSNEAPDVIKHSNSMVITLQKNGLLESLDANVEKHKLDLSQYYELSVEANKVDGNLYALPLTAYSIQMYYNKDLLTAAGYSEPPETMEEMYDMAVAATVLDDNGNIDILGYPLFPLASARQELIYGFGGRWWAEDGVTTTPDSEGVIASLTMNAKYRSLYGVDAVSAFVATANTNRYTEQDMFFQGKQLFRLDGPWLPGMMAEKGANVNWGITLIPGTQANPDARGTSRFETDSVAIPAMAENKEGAWDFIQWLTTEGARDLNDKTGALPALNALQADEYFLSKPGFDQFIASLQDKKGIQFSHLADASKYWSLIEEHLDYVYNGTMSPEDAMAELAKQAADLS